MGVAKGLQAAQSGRRSPKSAMQYLCCRGLFLMNASMVARLIVVRLVLLLGPLVLGLHQAACAQSSLDQLPDDLRRLIVVTPDPKTLFYLEGGGGVRHLRFQHEEEHEDNRYCNNRYGRRVMGGRPISASAPGRSTWWRLSLTAPLPRHPSRRNWSHSWARLTPTDG